MKDHTEKEIENFIALTTKTNSIHQIDFCLKRLYYNKTKNLFDQVLEKEDLLTFGEIIKALHNAKYDLKYAQALELQYENEPIPTELLIELGIKDKPLLRRIK